MNKDESIAVRVNAIFEEAKRLSIAARSSMALYFVVVTIGGIWFDTSPDAAVANLVLTVAQIGLGFFVTVKLITDGNLSEGVRGGFGTYFGLSLVTTLAIAIGALVFVVPGIVLFVRWAPVYGFGLVDGDGIGSAMGRSFERTGPHFWPILTSLALPVLAALVIITAMYMTSDEYGNIGLVYAIIGNVGISIASLGIMAVCMAVYGLLAERRGTLVDVFE